MHHPIDYSELGLLVMFRRAALRLTRAGDHRLTGRDDSSPPRRPSRRPGVAGILRGSGASLLTSSPMKPASGLGSCGRLHERSG